MGKISALILALVLLPLLAGPASGQTKKRLDDAARHARQAAKVFTEIIH